MSTEEGEGLLWFKVTDEECNMKPDNNMCLNNNISCIYFCDPIISNNITRFCSLFIL